MAQKKQIVTTFLKSLGLSPQPFTDHPRPGRGVRLLSERGWPLPAHGGHAAGPGLSQAWQVRLDPNRHRGTCPASSRPGWWSRSCWLNSRVLPLWTACTWTPWWGWDSLRDTLRLSGAEFQCKANGLGSVGLKYQFHDRVFLLPVALSPAVLCHLLGALATYQHPGPVSGLSSSWSRMGLGPLVWGKTSRGDHQG